ncbi:MAG: hypothetical protein KG075_17045 [Alphaproteobacteria bacterium]|nr:hypothetical protein [Alphaproteobacteria bacterium]
MRQPSHSELAEKIDRDAAAIEGRFARGEERFRAIEDKLDRLLDAVECIPAIQSDLAEVKENAAKTKEIVEAWSAVKTMGKFLKWLAAIVAALTTILIAIKVSAAHLLR